MGYMTVRMLGRNDLGSATVKQLAAFLLAARRELFHHGKRSTAGRSARKDIAAAKEEFVRRGLAVPTEGACEPEETLASLLKLWPEPRPVLVADEEADDNT
jgi:hypothetical protein